jgi:hypothetical protein
VTEEVEKPQSFNGHEATCVCADCVKARADAQPLSFEREYQLGQLPTFHVSKNGQTTPFHELEDRHLFLAHRWFLEHSRGSATYMALQREKERRRRNLPVPETGPTPLVVLCPDCGERMVLRNGAWGRFWGCSAFPKCHGKHGAHPDGRPLGTPATKGVRAARIRAHTAFDQLWQKNEFSKKALMKRKDAYSWLQQAMGLTADQAHIAHFNIEQCEQLIERVDAFLKERTT